MAGKKKGKSSSGEKRYVALHKLKAAVSLLAVFVVTLSGMMANVSLTAILWRSTIVVIGVMIVTRIVVQVLVTNEEMHSGEG